MTVPSQLPKTPTYCDTFIGIDPGQEGGIAVIFRDGKLETYKMPESDLELIRVFQAYEQYRVFACLEKVSSSPQMGVASAFTFGKGYGRLSIAVLASGIPLDLVTPQAWQKALMIPKRASHESQPAFKERLRLTAQRIFPKYPLWNEPKSLGRQRAVADAILIAQYCQLRYGRS